MKSETLRILLLADTHLGFDMPERPRITIRRRGPDFFANLEQALGPARHGQVDLVVHAGDLFHRRRVSPAVLERGLTPLAEIAQSGVPVLIVPGNHEGSRIPLHLATATPNLHIFHRPSTFVLRLRGIKVGLAGFPFTRHIGEKFEHLAAECNYAAVDADCLILCIHQSVEGAVVGVQNFIFRSGKDVILGRSIPVEFDAVLAGHIHRGQQITHDLSGRRLPAPVVYPGSTERTSFVERDEEKQVALVTLKRSYGQARFRADVQFMTLSCRPMVVLSINSGEMNVDEFMAHVRKELAALDPDSVVQVRLVGPISEDLESAASAASIRSFAPETMNVTVARRFGQRQRSDPDHIWA